MEIKLKGENRQLAYECLVERYRANISEKRSNWIAHEKHVERANKKINKLFERLHLDSNIHDIKIDFENMTITVTNKEIGG